MASVMGWKDILRPIRDGYRHLFPAPDTGPTPEERRVQRERDRLKGFTYFDNFDQLYSWDTGESDPLQRANTPLLLRGVDFDVATNPRSSVLLCHDYAGNYHDYESVQGADLNEEMYACDYLLCVDTFIYFSHKLVCVPPPTWTNTLHRNGVRALGTILVEPQTKETERLLEHTGIDGNMLFSMTKILADIAKHYAFDGYLVNIESSFPKESWSPTILQVFLAQLRTELGDDRQLIWYDALTTSNNVAYQNGLSASNLPFAEACGSVLTNYCWTESEAMESKSIALQSAFPFERIYFGIDVWAQNKTGLTRSRETYPKKGGGGTNTGVAVAKLAELGLSSGIFAPAWSLEHFPDQERRVERTMWEGMPLPTNIECSCGNAPDQHQQHKGTPIVHSAQSLPAGSETFFYTDFTRAFARHNNNERRMRAQVGAQSLLPLPCPWYERGIACVMTHRTGDSSPSKLIVETNCYMSGDTSEELLRRWMPLYKLNMAANGSLRLRATCRNLTKTDTGAAPCLYLRFNQQEKPQRLPIEYTEGSRIIEAVIATHSRTGDRVRLTEIGVYFSGASGAGIVDILEIYSISIMPSGHHSNMTKHSIYDIHTERRGNGPNSHVRLCWNFNDHADERISGVPYSQLTGPFSHFLVSIDGTLVGRAYAQEWIMSKEVADEATGKELAVEVIGVGLDGRDLARQTSTLRMGGHTG